MLVAGSGVLSMGRQRLHGQMGGRLGTRAEGSDTVPVSGTGLI